MLGEPEILACCDRCGCDSEPLDMTATVAVDGTTATSRGN